MIFISKLFQVLLSNSNLTVNNSIASSDTRKTINRGIAQKLSLTTIKGGVK